MLEPNRLRARVHRALEPDADDGRLSAVSWFLVGLVLLSFVTLALETETARADTTLPGWVGALVSSLNVGIVVAFAAEYGLRLWAAVETPRYAQPFGRLRYALTPMALADLAAFLPELILTIAHPEAGGALLAALRALRLFRLFKLARYVPAFAIVGRALRRSWPPLIATLCVAGVQIYVAALTLYLIEGRIPEQEASFGSITRALWWAVVTLTTVGYGDVYPVTPLGKIAGAIMLLTGVGIVAMPTGIIASAFTEEYRERQDAKKRARPGP